jgi:hypothetical protein
MCECISLKVKEVHPYHTWIEVQIAAIKSSKMHG